MKRACFFAMVLAQGAWGVPCPAQGIRAVTRPVLMSPVPGAFFQTPIFAPNPVPARAAVPAGFASASARPGPSVASKEEVARNTLAFQRQRAEAGAAHAQFDLGVRYLTGDGVKKDLETARKWLTAAAANGNAQATRKLQQLKTPTEQPAPLE